MVGQVQPQEGAQERRGKTKSIPLTGPSETESLQAERELRTESTKGVGQPRRQGAGKG